MKYTDIKVGDKESLTHAITTDDLGKFVELTGDDNKLHMDEAYASRTSFKKPVVHGMLGASFISAVIGTKLPGDGALWFSQTLEFIIPVRVGDTLVVEAEVIKKYDKDQIIELRTEIKNQFRQVVTRGIAKVKIIEQEQDVLTAETALPPDARRTALVIGGTGGIGREVCLQLAKDGMDVIIHYNNNAKKANEIRSEIEKTGVKAVTSQADLLDEEQIKAMLSAAVRAYGKIDVLVNCVATVIPAIKFQHLEWSDFSRQLDMYVKSAFLILNKAIPLMVEKGYGKIIHIGSYAVDKPNNDWAHYITAKAAVWGMTRALALEFAPKGLRINMVTPSLVDTNLTSDIPEKTKLLTASQTPARRLASASDVAGAVSFLASAKSDFLVGENIRVNGGQIML